MAFVLALVVPGLAQAQAYGCTYHSYERCSGNGLYWYDSCGNQQDLAQYCTNGCYNNYCQNYNNNYNNNCVSNYQEKCSGNSLYWYDSCGNQQTLAQYCTNGCYNNLCQNYSNNYNSYNGYNSYGNCTYHAYKLCSGNNVYWYDSCGTQQDIYYSCSGGQVCQYGQCVNNIIQPVVVQPISNYVAQYKTACYGSSIHWFDSLGADSGLYKNCTDNNSCTLDSCSGDKCSNILKCDGSTCVSGSADFISYCSTVLANTKSDQTHCGNGLCEPNLGETNSNCPTDCKLNVANGLSVSFFTKQDSGSTQWQKAAQIGPNTQAYFMITVANSSTVQVDNVNVSTNIPSEISSLGNLQLNGVSISGDIVAGVNIGSIAPAGTKSLTFEGKIQTISTSAIKQAMATINASGSTQSDSVSITLNPSQVTAAVSSTATPTSGFWGFLKQWYLWILVALILVFLFIIVFKRLSSEA